MIHHKTRKYLSLIFKGCHVEFGPWFKGEHYDSRPAILTIWQWHPWMKLRQAQEERRAIVEAALEERIVSEHQNR